MFRAFIRLSETVVAPGWWFLLAMLMLVIVAVTEVGFYESWSVAQYREWKTVHNVATIVFLGWWVVLLIHYAVSYRDWLQDSVDRFKNSVDRLKNK